MKKKELIFVPTTGVGHIIPMLEFANRLLNHDDHITITILVMKLPLASFLDTYIESHIGSQPRIRFIQLSEIVYPPQELLAKSAEGYMDAVFENYKLHVRTAVSEIISSRSNSTLVVALVLDLFCVTMIDIGNEFGIPSYMYLTSGASYLSLMLAISDRDKEVGREFKISDPELSLPAFANPVPVQVLPSQVFDTNGGYAFFLKIYSRFRDAKGILVNTFSELESYANNSFSDGETPPIYPVGPVVDIQGLQPRPEVDRAQWDKIMKWLDEQPQSSVLFLCFGSFGSFNATQVEEIAVGLEKSGCRFLWCLRDPPKMQVENHLKNPEEILPQGFLERIGERGIVCGWAPQVEVLGHKAIGGFMSHCGWNSILESLWHGVPIMTLPIYAEQRFNAFLMVKELGIAEELRLDYRRAQVVRADEIERAVKRVMQSDSVVRKKVKEMEVKARKAVMEGGSASVSIAKFIKDMGDNIS